MSGSDHTNPDWVARDRGECGVPSCGGYPCRHLRPHSRVQAYRRRANRRNRTKLRADLACGREPSVDQHRHTALWEAW